MAGKNKHYINKGIQFFLLISVSLLLLYLSACGGMVKGDAHAALSDVDNPAIQENTGSQRDSDSQTGGSQADGSQNNTPIPQDPFIFPVEGTRPYAIMIDNEGARSLPQGGLDKAQIIYEIIVEGGETRLMPLFWNVDPPMIGSVRSSRHYFLDYVLEYDAIYIHFGWSPQAMRDIPKLKINNINGVTGGGQIFWDLTKDKGNWQDSYTSMANIKNYVKKVKYRTSTDKKPVFTYNPVDSTVGNTADGTKVTIEYNRYYSCGFTYDSATKTYLRFRKNVPQVERVTGKQLTVKNIIIQNMRNYTIAGDNSGRQELVDVGSGSGWLITCGKAVKIKWSKASRNSQTKYIGEDGKPMVLNPGQTWIQIVPLNGKVLIE